MKLTRSFRFAWGGIVYCVRTQQNFRIHLVILSVVCFAGIVFDISGTEWMFVVMCGTSVLVLEAINTALEYMCDLITKDFHPGIGIIKDVAAAAVLIAAAGSVLIGLIIFLPKIISLLT